MGMNTTLTTLHMIMNMNKVRILMIVLFVLVVDRLLKVPLELPDEMLYKPDPVDFDRNEEETTFTTPVRGNTIPEEEKSP